MLQNVNRVNCKRFVNIKIDAVYKGSLCETDSPDTGEVARSARRGTLPP